MKIKEEFDTLTVTYEGRVPELQSKLNHTKSQITLLQQEAEEKCSKNRKRGNVDQLNIQNKKSKDQASEEPSSIESQVKQAIDKAMGQLTFPNRGRGFGRGRGRGQRGRGRGRF